MSLKFFHILFISTSVLLAVGMGMMTMQSYLRQQETAQLAWSLLCFGAALALVVYGVHIRKKLRNVGLLLASVLLVSYPRVAWACATCYGDPESPQTRAMNVAIVVMLGVVGTLLCSFAAFFMHLRLRAKHVANGERRFTEHPLVGRGERA